MNSHVLSEIEMLANRVAIIERGKVIVQDELRNLLTLDRELYSVTFEADGAMPDYLTSVERLGNLVKREHPQGTTLRLHGLYSRLRPACARVFAEENLAGGLVLQDHQGRWIARCDQHGT
jgi:ABC-type multidrug transport system ATPase subunit